MLKFWPEMRKYLLVWSLCHDSCTILSHTMVSNDKHLQVCAPSITIYTFKICWSDLWTSCDNNRSSLLEAVCYRLSLIREEIHRCGWHHRCLSQEGITVILNHGEQVKGTSGAYIIHSFIVHFFQISSGVLALHVREKPQHTIVFIWFYVLRNAHQVLLWTVR
jgi:hypothetical protein